MTSLILNFSICFSNLNCFKNCFCFSACSILNKACSFLKKIFMSFALCLSNFTSSFKACSWSLIFNSFCFCLSFSRLIFSCLSFSNFSNFSLLNSSFLVSLYSEIVLAILSKKACIYFSILKLILKFNWGFKEFWKLIIFKMKFCFLNTLLFLIIFFIFRSFLFDLIFFTFLEVNLDFFLTFFFTLDLVFLSHQFLNHF